MLEAGDLFRAGNYSVDEIDALAEGYEELKEFHTKAWIHVRLIDMWRAFDSLTREHQGVILLVGMYGLSTRAAAPILGVSHTTVAKRYNQGLSAMRLFLNRS